MIPFDTKWIVNELNLTQMFLFKKGLLLAGTLTLNSHTIACHGWFLSLEGNNNLTIVILFTPAKLQSN